jgi:rod shape-determining protein MreC
VSAVTDSGEVLGIVAPSASADPNMTVLEFRGVAYRDTVPDGTLVVTAGLGGVYPRGIAIGRVNGIRREELGWERVYRLVPVVNPGVVSHVLLLTASAAEMPPATGDSIR